MEKKYIVNLSESDRKHLQEIVGKGRHAASKIKRANILLKADVTGPGWPDTQIAEAFGCHLRTVRKRTHIA